MKPRILSTAHLSFPLAAALAALLASHSAIAGNTWDGTGGTGAWNTNANWNGDTAPSTGTALTFAGNVQNSTNNNLAAVDPSFAGILFTNTGASGNTNAFTLAGNRITLSGNITTTANTAGTTITDIISLNMILNGDRTITTNQQSASVQHNLTISGIISESGTRGLTKAGAGTLILSGANTYTGATTLGTAGSVTSGGTLTVSGTAGTINASSGYTINGSGSRLLLDNTDGNVDRLKDANGVTLNLGGELSLTGNGTTNSTETVASLALGTGSSIVTVASAASRVSTLAVTGGISRTNRSTALVRGTSLDQSAATNVGRITLGTAPSGADFVGTNSLSGGAVNDATKALKIVPWLFGATTPTGTGSNFVTYDSTLGLRVLNATEMDTLSAGSTTAANPVNALAFNGTVTTSGLTVNSLLFNTNAQTLNGSGALTVNSGAAASVVAAGTIGSGFSSLVLGNGEGILTSATGTFLINTPVNVTSSGGLTKAGGGNVTLGASNLYAGQTTVNQGQLIIGSGTAGDLGSNTANIVLNGGGLSFGRTNSGLTLSNTISGSGFVTQNGTGTTVLSGENTYTGTTTVSAGTLTLTGNRTVTATGGYTVSGGVGATQTLNIQNGNYGMGGNFIVGNGGGAATVNHSAGTISSVANGLIMGNGSTAGTSGTYNLSGGALTSASIIMGSNSGFNTANPNISTFTLSGTGALTSTTLRIGRYDFAGVVNTTNTFTQTGGTTTITTLGLGGSSANAADSTGPVIATLNLTGGSFSATTIASLSAGGATTVPNANSSFINIGGTAQVTLGAIPTARGTNSTATITFDTTTGGGGFLAPQVASATYMPAGTFTKAFLTANGANFNVGTGKDITIGQVLENAVSPAAAGTLTKSGVGVLTLSGTNTYTGATTVNAGTLSLGHATNTLSSSSAVTVDGATAVLSIAGNSDTVGAVSLKNGGSITGSGGTLTGASYALESGSVSAKLGGAGIALTKTTAGTVTLSGTNDYTGATTISGGTLALGATGSITSPNIIVGASTTFDVSGVTGGYTLGAAQTLSGTGSVVGPTAVAGTLSPGNSIGTLNFTNTLSLAGISNFEIDPLLALGLNADRANVTNGVTYGGTLNVLYGGSNSNFTNGMIFNLFDGSSFSGSFTAVNLPSLTGTGLSWQNDLLSNGTLTIIPEPNVAALIGALGGILLLRRRR